MRSRPARLTLGFLVLLTIGAAAFFIVQSEQQISRRRANLRAFDLQSREVMRALADLRAAQQAYVATGQDATFWMPKVASLIDEAAAFVDTLRTLAVSAAARESLLQAGATITEFRHVDQRAREYVLAYEILMAGDVVFTEGGEIAAQAGRHVDGARLKEHEALDASEAILRRREAGALCGAAIVCAGVMVLLAFAGFGRVGDERAAPPSQPKADVGSDGLLLRDAPRRAGNRESDEPQPSASALRAAADVCTDLGRLNDPAELSSLLVRAANALDARGLIIWLGSPAGADLRPVLAHGYPPQALARMPAVPRSANNAAAAAYRTGKPQVVHPRAGASGGALVAPLISQGGCIGALTAEFNGHGATSIAVQSLAAIFAAQLSSLLASPSVPSEHPGQGQIAI